MPRSKGRAQTNDLTHGPIARKLLIFSLPLFLATLAQQLYNTVDLLFAGNILGASAAAAIGASSLFVTCIVGFFGGMSVGSGVVIAQVFGKRETQTLDAAIHSTVALSLIGGVFFMVAGYLAAPWFLAVINTPADIMTEAVVYLRVYFFSLMSVMAYNFGAGALRALGNSKSPLVAQVVGGLCNVVFDWLFLAVLGWGVAGVAWATLVSQTVAAACVIWCLTRLDERYALRLRKIKLDIGVLKHALSIGLPAGFQALAITLSNVIVQYFINSLGTATVAAFALYFKVELVIYLPIVAFGQAIMTFAAQNYGARSYVRIRRGTFIWVGVSALIALATSLAALAGGAWLFRLFVQDAEVIALG